MKIIFYTMLLIYVSGWITMVLQEFFSYRSFPIKKKKKVILNNEWIDPLADEHIIENHWEQYYEQIKEEKNEFKKIVSKKPKINSKLI